MQISCYPQDTGPEMCRMLLFHCPKDTKKPLILTIIALFSPCRPNLLQIMEKQSFIRLENSELTGHYQSKDLQKCFFLNFLSFIVKIYAIFPLFHSQK